MSVSSAYCTHTTELTLCLPASAIGGTLNRQGDDDCDDAGDDDHHIDDDFVGDAGDYYWL